MLIITSYLIMLVTILMKYTNFFDYDKKKKNEDLEKGLVNSGNFNHLYTDVYTNGCCDECCDMCEVSEWGQYIVIDKFKIQ